MLIFWDDETGQVIGRDGGRDWHLFLMTKEQTLRWQGLGYDIHAAIDRERAWAPGYQVNPFSPGARETMLAYTAQEERIALASGVPADDPDFWRIGRIFKQFGADIHLTVISRAPLTAGLRHTATPDLFAS